jgi:signal transduction histidine kinase/GAF domain-containing protein
MSDALAHVSELSDFAVVWLATDRPLVSTWHEARLPEPRTATRLLLANGQVVVEGNVVFIPLVAQGLLHGWIAGHSTGPLVPAITSFAAQCAAALLLTEAPQGSRDAERERTIIDMIVEATTGTLDLDLLLRRIAAGVGELIDARGFYVALIDRETDELSFAYMHTPENAAAPDTRWPAGHGLTGHIVRTGEPLVTDDYLEECHLRGIAPQGPPDLGYAKAWLGVPLRHNDQTLGVMVVTHAIPGVVFKPSDVQLLSTVAAQAAAAVANAQLYARADLQAKQLTLINQIGRTIASTLDLQAVPSLLVRELTSALEIEAASLYRYDPDSGSLVANIEQHPSVTRNTTPSSTAYRALEQGEILISTDTVPGEAGTSQSIMCAPLTGRQFRGVIELRSRDLGRFRATDVALMQAVAEQATIALENAQLYGQTDEALRRQLRGVEEHNRQLANVVAIGDTMRAALSVEELSDVLCHAVHELTESRRVVVGTIDIENDRLRLTSSIGLDQARVRARWVPLGEMSEWLKETDQVGRFTHHVGVHPWLPAFEDAYVVAIHDARRDLVGAVLLDAGDEALPLTADLLQSLEIVANQAGIAFTSAGLYTEQQRTVDRLTALNALSLTVSTQQLSDSEVITMAIAGAIGTTGGVAGGVLLQFEDQPAASYVAGLTVELNGAWIADLVPVDRDFVELVDGDIPAALASENIQRVLVAPLRGAKQSIGTLWIGYTQATGTTAERETAVLYARMTGAVLENIYLAAAVRNARDRMASILTSTREGMLLVGEDLRVSIANPAFAALLSVHQEAIQGNTIHDVCTSSVLTGVPSDVQAAICSAVEQVVAGAIDGEEGQLSLLNGPERFLTWSVLPVRATAGMTSGALLVLRDVTADRQMERLRQDLANMIVHDLRSPLTNMLVSVDLLLKPATGPLNERQARILNIASSSCHQMLDLINALLDIRRLERQTLDLDTQPTSLANVADGVLDVLERIAEDKVVRVAVELDSLPDVEADAEMIRRVLQNLVDNALKFSPPETTVQITGARHNPGELPEGHPPGDWIVVNVQDQGTGVPEEYQQLIFELFVQAPEGHGHGTGIGLAFCKLAVEAHGGRIWVESTPGNGATFRFTLPIPTRGS